MKLVHCVYSSTRPGWFRFDFVCKDGVRRSEFWWMTCPLMCWVDRLN